jgi:hypothetical protein
LIAEGGANGDGVVETERRQGREMGTLGFQRSRTTIEKSERKGWSHGEQPTING